MNRTIYFVLLLVVVLAISVGGGIATLSVRSSNLTYVDRFEIEYKSVGLTEPSGLALSHSGDALWTVSDKTNRIFKLKLNGELQYDDSFEIPHTGLEGICLDPTAEFLYMVNENDNEIIKVSIGTRSVVDRKAISEMAGYQSVAGYFDHSPPNKGLEGITWNTDTGSLFVLKEAVPGLIMEVSSDLTAIQAHALLNRKNGFTDADTKPNKLDFSGISYDPIRRQFWIVSDKGQRLFLYDWQANQVVESSSLRYDNREIKKAEGVAIDPVSNRLYIVSDKEARLYVFDLREET